MGWLMNPSSHHRYDETTRALADISDAGLFENLATAVLRRASPDLYANLTQPGVNAEGKPVKSPVDAISFVPNSSPCHLVAVHHTTCQQDDLRDKWLNDPAKVTPRKGTRPTAPAGDVLKAAAIATLERRVVPGLRVTLALTTNREPPEDVTREAERVAHAHDIVVDIWSRSRIALFLDQTPDGQRIRRQYLGVEQERLCQGLLRDLSRKSLELHQPRVQQAELVVRRDVLSSIDRLAIPVGFLVGESGFGKSVACHQYLREHLEKGHYGLVLPHDILASSLSLDLALDAALRQLHPALAPDSGAEARSMCSSQSPLFVVVEDISRSGRSAYLLERLARWANNHQVGSEGATRDWRLVCPVWPELFASLGDEARKQIEPLATRLGPFAPMDAREAILRRAAISKTQVSELDADLLAARLGRDPLLIGLSDLENETPPENIIARFIAGSTDRIASGGGSRTAYDYVFTLRVLAGEILVRRRMDPAWSDVIDWFSGSPDRIATLRELVRHGEIVRVAGDAHDARLSFRHDRVRKWLLVDAATHALRADQLDEEILGEPFFADVIGAAIADPQVPPATVERARGSSPLALFYALQAFRDATAPIHHAALSAISSWLSESASHSRAHQALRLAALRVLTETQSSHVVPVLRSFRDRPWTVPLAGLRNGDLKSGVDLCASLEPGTGAGWRDRAIEHTRTFFGSTLVAGLSELLQSRQTARREIVGSLRFAGHLADTSLVQAIQACWNTDDGRVEHLDDYLWAASQCGGGLTAQLLSPICDAWAALSDVATQKGLPSPRNMLAAHHLAWAFWQRLPEPALRFFIERARSEDLRWPITYMLHGVDHPEAVHFVASELALRARALAEKNGFLHFTHTVCDHWRRQQREGSKGMSSESRARLQYLWTDDTSDEYLRKQSFSLWAATSQPGDVPILLQLPLTGPLEAALLRARLERGDQTAVSHLIGKIRTDNESHWWYYARTIWSDELTATLDERLTLRGQKAPQEWGDIDDNDWIMSEQVTRLEQSLAESLLCKHWSHLRFSPRYLQAALYTATPRLLELAAEAVRECPSPALLFEHVDSHFGVNTLGHPGVTRIEQMNAIAPYLDHVGDLATYHFWGLCNERGWLSFRRRHLDSRLVAKWRELSGLDDTCLFDDLDRELLRDQAPWMDHWVERLMEGGRTREEILNIVIRWLASNRSSKALEVAASIVGPIGTRTDIDRLRVGSEGSQAALDIIEDARFAVRRRTLN
jgi:hypothetical protein